MTALKPRTLSPLLPMSGWILGLVLGTILGCLFWTGCGMEDNHSNTNQSVELWDVKYEMMPTYGGCRAWAPICSTKNIDQVSDDGTAKGGSMEKDMLLVNARYGAGSAKHTKTICQDPSLPDGGYRVMVVDTANLHQVRYYLGDQIVGGTFFTSSPGPCQYAYFGVALPSTCCN